MQAAPSMQLWIMGERMARWLDKRGQAIYIMKLLLWIKWPRQEKSERNHARFRLAACESGTKQNCPLKAILNAAHFLPPNWHAVSIFVAVTDWLGWSPWWTTTEYSSSRGRRPRQKLRKRKSFESFTSLLLNFSKAHNLLKTARRKLSLGFTYIHQLHI